MANPARNPPVIRRGDPRPLMAGPRSEAVSGSGKPLDHSGPSLLERLTSLAERSSSALGRGYALAASTVLRGLERLDDLNAERRFRQRARRRRAISPGASPS